VKSNFTPTHRSIRSLFALLIALFFLSGCGHNPRNVVTGLWRRDIAAETGRKHGKLRLPSFRSRFASMKTANNSNLADVSKGEEKVGRVSITRLEPPRSHPSTRARFNANNTSSERVIIADDPFARRANADVVDRLELPTGAYETEPTRVETPVPPRATELPTNRTARQTPNLKLLPDEETAPSRTAPKVENPSLVASKEVRSETNGKEDWFSGETKNKSFNHADNNLGTQHRDSLFTLERGHDAQSRESVRELMKESRSEMQQARLSELVQEHGAELTRGQENAAQSNAFSNPSTDSVASNDAESGPDILIVASESVPPRIGRGTDATSNELVSLQPLIEIPEKISIVPSHGQPLHGNSESGGVATMNLKDSNAPNTLRLSSSQFSERDLPSEAKATADNGTTDQQPFPSLSGPVLPPSLLPDPDFDESLITLAASGDPKAVEKGESLVSPNWDLASKLEPARESQSPWAVLGISLLVVLAVAVFVAKRRGSKIETVR